MPLSPSRAAAANTRFDHDHLDSPRLHEGFDASTACEGTEDCQLIALTLAGDSGAYEALVRRYQNRLYNNLVRVVGCAAEAEDVCQEAFVQAYLNLQSFRQASAFYTWLYRIAMNASINRRRRAKIFVSVEQAQDLRGDEPVDRQAAPHQRMEQSERARQVRAALAMLSREHREVVVLRDMEGLAYETISAMLALPMGTVRSRLHRARLDLREQLCEP